MLQGCGEKGTIVLCWQECKGVSTMEKIMKTPQKLKTELTRIPAILLLGIDQDLEKHTNTL